MSIYLVPVWDDDSSVFIYCSIYIIIAVLNLTRLKDFVLAFFFTINQYYRFVGTKPWLDIYVLTTAIGFFISYKTRSCIEHLFEL